MKMIGNRKRERPDRNFPIFMKLTKSNTVKMIIKLIVNDTVGNNIIIQKMISGSVWEFHVPLSPLVMIPSSTKNYKLVPDGITNWYKCG